MNRPLVLRLLALAGATALVLAALVVRSRLDDGERGGGTDRASTSIRCAPELAEPCTRLARDADFAVEIESAGMTADLLATVPDADVDNLELDAWVVPQPWPAIVDAARGRAGLEPLFGEPSAPVARSPLVLAMFADRAGALAGSCSGGEVGWKCLGDAAGRPWADVGGKADWGAVEVAIPDPEASATGLAVLGQAVAEYFGRTDLSREDFELDDGFLSWFGRLAGDGKEVARVEATGLTPLDEMLGQGPSSFAATGTSAAEACPKTERAAAGRRPALLYPPPVATLDVVVAPRRGADAERVGRAFTDEEGLSALRDAGFVAGKAPSPACGAPEPPADSGLPDAGALVALQQLWEEVVG